MRPAYPESWLFERIRPTCETAALALTVAMGYRRSSNVVVPTLTVAPSGIGVGTVTREPLRKVPFVESRSWIIHRPFQSMSRAWWVEV